MLGTFIIAIISFFIGYCVVALGYFITVSILNKFFKKE